MNVLRTAVCFAIATMLGIATNGCAGQADKAGVSPADRLEPSAQQELVDLRRENAALRERLTLANDQLKINRSPNVRTSATKLPSPTPRHANNLPTVHLQAPPMPAKRVQTTSLAARGGFDPDGEAAPEIGHDPLTLAERDTATQEPTSAPAAPTGANDPSGSRQVVRYIGHRSPAPEADPPASAAPVVPQPSLAEDKPPAAAINGPDALYDKAWRLFKTQDYAQADALWATLIHDHPKHDLADNAMYWRGEIAYHQGRTNDALTFFLAVVETYPAANKAPDALLKQGYCYLRLGETKRARAVLSRIVATQVGTEVAQVAARKLRELELSAQGSP